MPRITGFAGGAFIQEDLGVDFVGLVESLVLVKDAAIFPRDYSTRFSGSGLTFAMVGALPAGLSLSAAGVLTGTPTDLGNTAGLIIRATDVEAETADSNTFSINIVLTLPGVQRAGFVANAGRLMAR